MVINGLNRNYIPFIKEIPGYPGYYADVNGHIFSNKRGGLRRIKASISDRGYFRLRLTDASGHRPTKSVARLMMLTFHGPSDLYVNHINGDKLDNRLENLEYSTQKENIQHALRTGLLNKHHRFTHEDARKIRELYSSGGFSMEKLAQMYNTCSATIHKMVRGVTYRHENCV